MTFNCGKLHERIAWRMHKNVIFTHFTIGCYDVVNILIRRDRREKVDERSRSAESMPATAMSELKMKISASTTKVQLH